MPSTKLKYSELKDAREAKLKRQGGICTLCMGKITLADANYDHCHRSGYCRDVLHPECNILLGKIENFLSRWPRGLKVNSRLGHFLANAYEYMHEHYEDQPLHPKHKTPEDKLVLKYKRILKRSKKPETKAKYKKLIEDLS